MTVDQGCGTMVEYFCKHQKNFYSQNNSKEKGMGVWDLQYNIYKRRHYFTFCEFKSPMILKAIRHRLKTKWHPIMKKLEMDNGLSLPDDPPDINSDLIEATLTLGKNHKKIKVIVYCGENQM